MQEPRLPSGLSSRLLGRWEREASSNVGGDSGVDVFDSLRVRSFKRSSFAPGSSGSSTVADRSVFRSSLPGAAPPRACFWTRVAWNRCPRGMPSFQAEVFPSFQAAVGITDSGVAAQDPNRFRSRGEQA